MKAIQMIENEIGNVCDNPNISNNDIVELMKDYAKEKCKEQRKIIANGLPNECFMPITSIDEGHIMNMPEPKCL